MVWEMARLGIGKIKMIGWLRSKFSAATFAWVFLVAVLGALFVAHCLRHYAFATHAFDLTFLHQPLFWSLKEGLFHCDVCIGGNYLGEHLSFSLATLLPLTSFFYFDEWIFLLETLLVGGGIFLLAWRGPKSAPRDGGKFLLFSIFIFICHKALRGSVIWDFREDHLAFFGLCCLLVSLWNRWWTGFFLSFFLVLLSKENFGLVLAFLALPIFFDGKFSAGLTKQEKLRAALFCGFVGVLYTVVAFRFLIPLWNAGVEGENNIVKRFPGMGSTPGAVLLHLLTSPQAWWELLRDRIVTFESLKYLFILFAPTCFFAWRAWWWLVPALPTVAMNLLSSAGTQRSMGFHYELVILPFLFFAFLLGLRREMVGPVRRQKWAILITLALAVAVSGRWPIHEIKKYLRSRGDFADSSYLRNLSVVNSAGGDAVIGANTRVLAQLSRWPKVRELLFPDGTPALGLKQVSWTEITSRWQETRAQRKTLVREEMNYVVVDEKEVWEKKLEEVLLARGWKVAGRSPSGRFGVLTKVSGD